MLVCGPHTSGKTVFIMALIDSARQLFDIVPTTVYWCYGVRTKLHDKMVKRGYNMIQGIPPNFDFLKENSIIMLDDLMSDGANDKGITNLFIRVAHHKPVFVIFTQQNIFPRGAEARNRQLNTQYTVLFKNPRDPSQVGYLGRQVFPNSQKFLVAAYQAATIKPYSYLLLDFHQKTPEIARVRARILPHQRPMVAYVDKRLYAGITTSKYIKKARKLRHRDRFIFSPPYGN
jgi:hypothetical protein